MPIFMLSLLLIVFVYSLILHPNICKKKIYQHIHRLGGNVEEIEILSYRESLYRVHYYTQNNEYNKAIVRFSITYEEEWKF